MARGAISARGASLITQMLAAGAGFTPIALTSGLLEPPFPT